MKILFQGDSITDAARNRASKTPNRSLGDGYVTLIASKLCFDGLDRNMEIYNRGIGGDMTTDLYARWQRDTLTEEFDILSLLCGINDIGFRRRLGIGNSIEKFQFVYERLIYEVRENRPSANIVLMSPFIFRMHDYNGEFGDDIYKDFDDWKRDIIEEGEIVKEIAHKYNAVYIPLMDKFSDLCTRYLPEKFSFDCIHPTPAGNYVIAEEWIKAVKERGLIEKA